MGAIKKDRKYPKRILIDVTDEFHHEVKSRAHGKNMSMQEWVYLSLAETIRRERLEERKKDETV